MSDKSDLAALLGSRICHDLISPIGAIGNGLELLMMETGSRGPEMALISESVAHANARIRFFRVAFGAAAGEARLGRAEVASIISDMTKGGRLSIDWQTGADLSRSEVKIAFLLLMCLESAMAYGGKITVQVDGGRWSIMGEANKLRIDPALWAVLADPTAEPEITPSNVHFPLAAEEISRRQFRLAADLGQTSIKLSF
ncbi:histidine phosphotransferase family protein [Stagnihabitans tardus]|uniref:Histidine phosphotransferase n=1 Tax=Stagnihabitans tardus TaxID=2699202 RepID=A0AAE4YBH6_9RHOB|nr:histidine phosphotransferase family protein [Stagnihabitans tardus]NBZ89533.1 histidine phosphotransferase [Stagnihabitans tardus]